jgi:pimeloyl-ACP methyl ester carboxylesterase
MLRGDTASFEQAISLMFASMVGPLDPDEVARVEALRRPQQDVVLGIWGAVLESSPEQLDSMIEGMIGALTVPYLSLHGIDPGEGYTTWLMRLLPTAAVEVWPDQGHYPHLVQPRRFLERVLDFDRRVVV